MWWRLFPAGDITRIEASSRPIPGTSTGIERQEIRITEKNGKMMKEVGRPGNGICFPDALYLYDEELLL